MRITLIFAATAVAALAQNQLSADLKNNYESVRNNLVKSAEKMPESGYAFRPSHDVRSFGQLVGHVADATGAFCAGASGEKSPVAGVEKGKSTKAELVEALKAAFAFCDGVYNGMTDAKGAEVTKFFGRDRTRAGVLSFNNMHNNEHYGNIVTYLRIRGFVPPSSEGR
jgi:uncharacterized damage-inducible protein DinB